MLQRFPGIDALRGMSILFVVLHHVGIRIKLQRTDVGEVLPARLCMALNFNGYEAVFVFFVISGFLITWHALARYGSFAEFGVRDFYVRRFARIGPPLVVVVAALSVAHLLGVPQFTIDTSRQSLAGAVVAAFGLHLNWYEGRTGYLPGGWDVLWSLSIEEVFYLAFPVVCLGLRRKAIVGAVMFAFALTLPLSHGWIVDSPIWREKAYLPAMSAIAAGVATALVARGFPARPAWADRVARTLGAVAVTAVVGWGDLVWSVLGEGTMLVLVFGACAWVLGLQGLPAGEGARGLGWLRSLGRLSYEVYLTHMFVVFAVVGAAGQVGLDARHGWVWYGPALAGSWALGWAFARWVSVPLERALKGRLSRPQPSPTGI